MTLPEPISPEPTTDLIGCAVCDAIYTVVQPQDGERAVCTRCHAVLITPRKNAALRVTGLAVTVLILVLSATFMPFLQIRVAGLSNAASILDVALAFAIGPTVILALAVAALIVLIPAARVLLILYVLGPMVAGAAPWRHARAAFRLSEALRPWAMAEIFVIGCAVALIKVADLAQIDFGPAFWMFSVLVVILMFQDNYMCRWTIWKSLEDQRTA